MLSASSQYQLESALHEIVPCGDEATEQKIRDILHDALDDALKEHIKRTFEVWMKDDTQQPERAARGIRGGVNAYIQSQKALTKWKLLRC